MNFIDEAKIYVKAGDGGDGAVAFRREAMTPKGGPSGGDGGNGGDVIFVGEEGMSTLLDFRYQQHYKGGAGEKGRNKDQYGKSGEDLIVKVPLGTLVFDEATGETIADVTEHGVRHVIARGGRGGRGNIHFKTPWNQAPRTAEPGTPGEEKKVRLQLKLLADVGLVGYPNAGKSTFISVVSRARPKIADYPFTTLTPHLGVVGMTGGRSFVLADIPGLIEGAAEGAGLGHRFLRHVERTRVLVHLVELSPDPERHPVRDYEVLCRELEKYDPELAKRPQIVVLTKLDLPETRAAYPDLVAKFKKRKVKLEAVSAATGEGMAALLDKVWNVLRPGVGMPEPWDVPTVETRSGTAEPAKAEPPKATPPKATPPKAGSAKAKSKPVAPRKPAKTSAKKPSARRVQAQAKAKTAPRPAARPKRARK